MSGVSVSYGSGRIYAGEVDVAFRPRVLVERKRPGVVLLPTAGGSGASFGDVTASQDSGGGRSRMAQALARAGYVVLAGAYGGPHTFGNATAQARMLAGYQWLQAQPDVKPGKVIAIGWSMGSGNALMFARKRPDLVAGVVGCLPLVDLRSVYPSWPDTSLTNGIAAAWGVTRPNPLPNDAIHALHKSAYADMPMRLVGSSDDPLTPASFVEDFVTGLPKATFTNVGPLGHTDPVLAAGGLDYLLDFMDRLG